MAPPNRTSTTTTASLYRVYKSGGEVGRVGCRRLLLLCLALLLLRCRRRVPFLLSSCVYTLYEYDGLGPACLVIHLSSTGGARNSVPVGEETGGECSRERLRVV